MRSFVLFALALAASTANAFSIRGVTSESWMTAIKDDTKLCDLVLPGTHDSTAFDMNVIIGREFVLTQSSNISGGGYVLTQGSNIADQLARGIRYVDFRVGICEGTSDKLCMFHGKFYLNLNFDTALSAIKQFLGQHPSEAVVMRIQHENGGGLDDFQGFLEQNYLTKDPTLWFTRNATVPADAVTVGNVRGKILLFWDDGAKTSAFGYDYKSVNTRSKYEFEGFDDIVSVFEQRAKDSNVPGWYENPTSGIVFPTLFGYRLAPHPIAKTARTVLARETDIMARMPMKKGIVSMDFPTDNLIGQCIALSVDRFPKRR